MNEETLFQRNQVDFSKGTTEQNCPGRKGVTGKSSVIIMNDLVQLWFIP